MLEVISTLGALLVTAGVAWLAYKEMKRSESMLAQARTELAEDFNDLKARRKGLESDAAILVQRQKEDAATIAKRDKDVSDVLATLAKRDAELKNMGDSMRAERIRADAKVEGLEKQLRQEQESTKQLRYRLTEAEKQVRAGETSVRERSKRIEELSQESGIYVRQRDQLVTELNAAKTLLAGVKIGVGELLIVQPDECTEEALDALWNTLRSQKAEIEGRVVTVSHVNAWKAVPIPRATATKVEEVAQDSLVDVLAGKQDEELRRLWEGHKLSAPGVAVLGTRLGIGQPGEPSPPRL